ncbi:2-isopropylmalate synthase [bioreactor metagenome]|uniref:2-isopropylmalate synthase n=1 Tax=bioreactor metagenome TaxID=1076179 RepID=A0A645JHM0_9ZZZZ
MLPRLTELYETLSGSSVGPHKAVLGREVFTVGSGVHVDGILKNSANYEPYPPELVGARRRIVVGRHAGRVSVLHVLRQLGYQPDEAGAEGLLPLVRRESARLRRELTEGELAELARREGVI